MIRLLCAGLFSAALLVGSILHLKELPALSFIKERRLQGSVVELFNSEVREAQSQEYIRLDPDSTLYNDIVNIRHNRERRRITVEMKPNARCPRPVLKGRLSGRALGMIKWKAQEDNLIRGHYKVPCKGNFNIEIIGLYCAYESNDINRCLIHGEKHRVTALDAMIHVASGSELEGYWRSNEVVPLYTRWQPQDCRRPNARLPRCKHHDQPELFDKYSFYTDSKIMKLYRKFDTSFAQRIKWYYTLDYSTGWNCFRDTNGKCDLCTMGASHSLRLHRFVTILLGTKKSGGVDTRYPEVVDEKLVKQLELRCKNIVIGYGQHDIRYGNTSPDIFAKKIRVLLDKLRNHPRVFGRSVHYNPLGDEKLQCPPQDNRNPAWVDDYNIGLQRVYRQMGRPFIDTRFIDGPMWDSGLDWNHMHYKVELVHAAYIADQIGLLDSSPESA